MYIIIIIIITSSSSMGVRSAQLWSSFAPISFINRANLPARQTGNLPNSTPVHGEIDLSKHFAVLLLCVAILKKKGKKRGEKKREETLADNYRRNDLEDAIGASKKPVNLISR